MTPWSGARSAQRTFCFVFATANGLRAERSLFSKRSRALINSNSSFIVHSLGDIEYFFVMKKTLWVPPSLFAIANTPICRLQFVVCRLANVRCEQSFSRANGANVQQNVRCVRWAERAPGVARLLFHSFVRKLWHVTGYSGLRSVSKQFATVPQQSCTRDRKFCKTFANVSILNAALFRVSCNISRCKCYRHTCMHVTEWEQTYNS